MVGDTLEKDVIAPTENGIIGIYYTQDDTYKEDYPKVKKLTEVMKFY